MSDRSKLQELFKQAGGRREFFNMLATYSRQRRELSAERAADNAGLAYETVITIFKELQAIEIGRFVQGRRGKKTRLVLNFTPSSVGEAAQGRDTKLEPFGNAEEEEEIAEEIGAGESGRSVATLAETLDEAKRDLARKLHLEPEQIEITIKH